MPDKRELFGEIVHFDEYITEMCNHVSDFDWSNLTASEEILLDVYRELLITLEKTCCAITKVWDV